jgi:hypothetical protein
LASPPGSIAKQLTFWAVPGHHTLTVSTPRKFPEVQT